MMSSRLEQRRSKKIMCFTMLAAFTIVCVTTYVITYVINVVFQDRKDERDVLTEQTFLGAHQENPALVAYIRQHLLVPPSTLPYNLSSPTTKHFSQFGQSQYANNIILRNMTGGFFVEVGAVNGEYLSNTLFLERDLGWTGLLIEPLETYHDLLHKHRKAYSINAALSLTKFTTQVTFHKEGLEGGSSHIEEGNADKNFINNIKALPFYSILQAINITHIDFFSLDVESTELQVLKTIPWDKIRVRLMCIECNKVPEGRSALVKFLADLGYVFIGHRIIDCWFGWPDLIKKTSL